MSITWNWNYLWTGISVIASGITIWQAWATRNDKKEVDIARKEVERAKEEVTKVKNQIHTYVFGNELSELIKEGTDVCKQMTPLIATNINQKTVRGIDENLIISSAITFISNCKVKTSLVESKKQEITKLYDDAQQPIKQKEYSEVHKIITGLLEILEEERKKHI